MSLHKEVSFENEICEYLAANGWLHAAGDAQTYDRARALFPADLLDWVKNTQPKAWEALSKNHGAAAEVVLLDRLRKSLHERGTLDVLRHGIELLGLRQPLQLAQFKPALSMNPELTTKYAANRLRVVRQVRYSLVCENSIDLVLFLNGIPVATCELKTDFTQSVQDAVDQYRFDREPKPKGRMEPLLSFPAGALVHFAVSNREVRMTTRLEGAATRFLPFNLGNDGGAGNPLNPNGHATAYLWQQVWQCDSWLEIIARYLVAQKDKKQQLKSIIFPRYHQLDATRKLVAKVLEEGPGGKFLIQHSAGSGKTNSIAWAAHFLADLHDAEQQKLFQSVLVVSDRTVLDAQLQEAIFSFERTTGVVASITGESASKSGELAKALAGGKKIVVCTIQTFPFALKAVQELAATEGKRFAVIADEAHSSQTGEAASKLKQVLSIEELKELADGGEASTEDILAAQMSARSAESGITYVAFTATPKAKTLELFGRRRDSELAASSSNLPAPFHVYSMRQAIEEGFILDVLHNYTAYKTAFKLAHNGEELSEAEVERSQALKGIMRWVKLHPYNIAQKVQVVIEHFRENVQPLLEGKAKAMVVVSSRQEAVRWQLAIDQYVKRQGYPIGTLVAFSGEVNDPESGPDPFTETSQALNPHLRGRDIREAFSGDEYQILLVANKFQTGFDQPLLCGMYVDKKLGGIQAVQTLSRLNRAYPKKDTTYVLDFVNEPDEILTAFKAYYSTAELEDVTDPHLVYDLRTKLDSAGHYDQFEVERVVTVLLNPAARQSELSAALEPVANRLLVRYRIAQDELRAAEANGDGEAMKEARDEMDALVLFKRDMGSFQRLYAFLSQIFDYGNTDIEKRQLFFKHLLPLIEFGREREGVDLSRLELVRYKLNDKGTRDLPLVNGEYPKLPPMSATGSGQVQEKEKLYLSQIVEKVNELFGADTTDGDKLSWLNSQREKLLESEVLAQQAANNSKEQFASSPDLTRVFIDALIDSHSAQSNLSLQALNSEQIQREVINLLLGPARLYETLRGQTNT